MRRLLLSAALPIAFATTAFAGGHMAKFPNVMVDTNKDFFASDLIGMRVYQSEEPYDAMTPLADGSAREWDDIGEIGDIVVSEAGDIKAVIVDVGGFLGIGEREVAITFDQLKVLREEDDMDERFLVLTSNTELLETAPAFERGGPVEGNVVMGKVEEDRDMLRAPMIERDGYLEAKIADLTAEDIQGTTVYGINDEAIGEVGSLIVSADGTIERAVLDVGGFLGLGEKKVAVTFDELRLLKGDGDLRVYIDATQEELEAQPEFDG